MAPEPAILDEEVQELRRLTDLADGHDWPAAVERLTAAIKHLTPDAARAQLFLAILTLSAVRRGEPLIPPPT